MDTFLYPSLPDHSCSQGSIVQGNMQPNASPSPLSACNHTTTCPPRDPIGVRNNFLPKHVMVILQKLPTPSVATPSDQHGHTSRLLLTDTGATDHLLPNKAAFISYCPVDNRQVWMGNNSFAPILGMSSARGSGHKIVQFLFCSKHHF